MIHTFVAQLTWPMLLSWPKSVAQLVCRPDDRTPFYLTLIYGLHSGMKLEQSVDPGQWDIMSLLTSLNK